MDGVSVTDAEAVIVTDDVSESVGVLELESLTVGDALRVCVTVLVDVYVVVAVGVVLCVGCGNKTPTHRNESQPRTHGVD